MGRREKTGAGERKNPLPSLLGASRLKIRTATATQARDFNVREATPFARFLCCYFISSNCSIRAEISIIVVPIDIFKAKGLNIDIFIPLRMGRLTN